MSQTPTPSMSKKYPETNRFLQRIYCKLLAEVRDKNFQPSDRAFKMTGLGMDVLRAIEKGENLDLTNKSIDRSVIHKQLFNFYLSKNILPTTKELFHALGHTLPVHMDMASFRKLLYKMDYVWKKLVNNKFVVLERPEVTYERYMFLKQILEYHHKDVPIYFVEEWIVPMDQASSYDISETSDTTDKERIVFAFSKSEIVFRNSILPQNITEIEYKNWIAWELIPSLDKESVIVVNTEHYYKDLFNYPTINSLKDEMTDWLDRHKVPYGINMSKVELWSLIEEYTDVDCKSTTLDNVIRSYGHIPMRIPRHIHMLTPGYFLYEHIKKDSNFFGVPLDQDELRNKINSQMNSLNIELLEKYVNIGIMKYRTFLCDDLVLDDKIETIMRDVVSQDTANDVDSDLPLESDSD